MKFMKNLRLVAVTALMTVCVVASAAPKSDLWAFWDKSQESSTTRVDHAVWDGLLKRYIEQDDAGLNRFDYQALAANSADGAALDAYVESLASVDVLSLSRTEQLAYWINVYNAVTVDIVVESWPVGSIREIRDGLFSSGPWKRKAFSVNGKALSLNDIEHRILRPIYNDSRIHYAVNCASVGCPNLRMDAFTRDNAEALLDAGARDFINSARGVDVTGGSLTVSSIYDWFADDFGGNDAGVIAHLTKFARPDLAAKLKNMTRISRDQYDWRVNAAIGTAPKNGYNGTSDSDGRAGGGGS